MKSVKFFSKLTGSIDDLDVIIQGRLVLSPGFTVTYTESQPAGLLTVIFQISGFNGTGYDIVYSCTSNGLPVTDPAQPAEIKGEILQYGYSEITLKIPL